MLVSVTEGTREIGTRKALGAKNSAIRMQFIVESVIICLIGGSIGIIFGMLLGYAGASLLSPAHPSVDAILIAVCFSMAIGVFFGYYLPTRQPSWTQSKHCAMNNQSRRKPDERTFRSIHRRAVLPNGR